ncbi:hypothetical protein ONZ51_g9399 [Trametes cubensis]|uniref:Uncharacterized protein n=1 Tax=Trametes cubensis TaxID=1111947 RepID=A0AAD7TLH9_9APHY|nr:hypothetical protein ONZ51_g9399 [Trametes cubensis]
MASGYGYNGGVSRCFAYWQEFSKLSRESAMHKRTCLSSALPKRRTISSACTILRRYVLLILLNHLPLNVLSPNAPSLLSTTTQIARAKEIKAEFIRKAEHQANEGRKAADILADGVIVGVGLIQRGEAAKSK